MTFARLQENLLGINERTLEQRMKYRAYALNYGCHQNMNKTHAPPQAKADPSTNFSERWFWLGLSTHKQIGP